jgi:23S rRNA U2552 (ribose-2'-O)-methylase RlmE/FtsJ
MNDLQQYFENNNGRLIHKWLHYFEVYERYLSRFRGKNIKILEIGVSQGGSLQMWRNYFGPEAKIFGIDINPECKSLEEHNIEIFIGSQSDRKFLDKVRNQIGPVDILIDDGGHTMNQQIVSFEELFSLVKEDGVYICEDCHTSYWIKFGGGYRRKGTFMEFAKKKIDQLNAWHSHEPSLVVDEFTRTAKSMHFYDSMVVIEKGKVIQPSHRKTGNYSFSVEADANGFKSRALYYFNYILRMFRLPSVGF